MSLAPGSRIGPYEVRSPLGAGGMGEVYRARDTKLNRDVAIKVLPESVATDPERLERFEREAQALAALNHPNIGAVYAVEGLAIVMELVEGEDLSERISRAPIPITEALAIARQLTAALGAAHESGLVHRDLKPANVKVKEDGTIKVLDFGLVKALDTGGASGTTNSMNSPTLTARSTHLGIILGTAAYMAPEQARGKAVDKRADIWAFGVVLYEMLTGTRPFPGDDITDVLAAVVRAEPDWTALPAGTPPLVKRLLVRCLTKDPKQRLHDIDDARLDIDEAIAAPGPEPGVISSTAGGWPQRRAVAIALGTFLLGGLTMGTIAWRYRPDASAPVPTYLTLDVVPADEVNSGSSGGFVVTPGGARTAMAWSPDGKTLAFVGRKGGVQQIYVRDLGGEFARPLAETEGAQTPAFSPDGRSVAFGVAGTIRKVPIAGGAPAKMCDIPGGGVGNGIAWGQSRVIVATGRRLVSFVPTDAACTLTNVTDPSPGGVRHASPHLLPGDAAVLYTEHFKQWTSGDERVMVQRLPDGEPRELVAEASDARYLPSGHIVFMRQGTLFGVGFDAASLALRGSPVALVKGVTQSVAASSAADLSLGGQFAISPQGSLAYIARPLAYYPDVERVSFDRKGVVTPRGAPVPGLLAAAALSPTGTQIASAVTNGKETRVFVEDLSRDVALTLVGGAPRAEAMFTTWSKANVIAFTAFERGDTRLVLVRPDGSSPSEDVAESEGFRPNSWSPDGTHLVGSRDGDLWIFSRAEKPALRVFTETPGQSESNPVWSPDGKWIAFDSDATGRSEVYVRPFPGPGAATLVSVRGGLSPLWNPSGGELFYLEPGTPRRFMAVRMTTPLSPGQPESLFTVGPELRLDCSPSNCYSAAADGQKFYGVRMPPQPAKKVTHINLILNWSEELKAKVR